MKITLANLHEATEQQVFDQVAEHLLTQNAKSTRVIDPERQDEATCLYRGPNGLKCAAGCLMDDSEYNPEFEYRSWDELPVQTAHLIMIRDLQAVHDDVPVDDWKENLRDTAKDYNLEWKFGE